MVKILFLWLKVFFKIFGRIWFILLTIAGGFLSLAVAGQSRDVFYGLINDGGWESTVHFIFLCLFTVVWSFGIWLSSGQVLRTIFHMDKYKDKLSKAERQEIAGRWKKTYGKLVKHVPWVLGMFPYIIGIIGFAVVMINYNNECNGWVQVVTLLVLFFFYLLFIGAWYTKIIYRYGIDPLAPAFDWSDFRKPFKIAMILCIAPYLFFCFKAIAIPTSQFLGPGTTILLSLTTITLFSGFLTWLNYKYKYPVAGGLVFFIILFSLFNNNDRLSKVSASDEQEFVHAKERIPDHFREWIKHDDHGFRSKDSSTVIIIAGQGGGSRASFWIGNVLSSLDSSITGFYNQTYAISTVSGSSVGTAFFNSLYLDALLHNSSEKYPDLSQALRNVAGHDYLSPNSTGLLYADLLQSMLPCGVASLDRSKFLEDAWSQAYYTQTGKDWLNRDYRFLWEDERYKYNVPTQVFNTTVVERGQKGIISKFILDDSDSHSKIFDVDTNYYEAIPLKTAMSLSARFPGLTSAGTLPEQNSGRKDKVNLSDGGYYENTGIETALSIVKQVVNVRRKDGIHVKVILLFVQNGKSDYYNNKKASHFLGIINNPLQSLYNSWNTESDHQKDMAEAYFKSLRKTDNMGDEFITVALDFNEDYFPLSRYISKTTQRNMIRQVRKMCEPMDGTETEVEKINKNSFLVLKNSLKH